MLAAILRVILVLGLVIALSNVVMIAVTLYWAGQLGGVLVTTPYNEGGLEICLSIFAIVVLSWLICTITVRRGRR